MLVGEACTSSSALLRPALCAQGTERMRAAEHACMHLTSGVVLSPIAKPCHARRGTGASERQLEALAIYMGHSMAMQRDTYDR